MIFDAGDQVFHSTMKIVVDYIELDLGKSFLESWKTRKSQSPTIVVEYFRLPKWKRLLRKSYWNKTFGVMCLNNLCKNTGNPEYCDWARRLRAVYLWYMEDYLRRPDIALLIDHTAMKNESTRRYCEENIMLNEVILLRHGMWA